MNDNIRNAIFKFNPEKVLNFVLCTLFSSPFLFFFFFNNNEKVNLNLYLYNERINLMKNFNNVSRKCIKYSLIMRCKTWNIVSRDGYITLFLSKNKRNFNEQDIIISFNGSICIFILKNTRNLTKYILV